MFKSLMGIIVPMVLLAVIVAVIGYKGITDAMMVVYENGAIEIARTAAADIDADQMDEYAASGGKTESYQATWENMNKLCNTSGATFIYVIEPDLSDYAHITFLFSTINEHSSYTVYDFGYVRETTNDEYKQKYKALYDGVSEEEIVIRDKGYIETDSHLTAMVPLKGSDGKTKAILCVQRQMETLAIVRNFFVLVVSVVLLLLVAAVVVIQQFYLRRVLISPIKKITKEASRFAEEEVPSEVKLTEQIKNNDEIGALADSIDQMETRISQYVDDLTRVTAEKERISTELSLASRIQSDMLPNIFPAFPERSEFDLYASMDPAKAVGGDFYDFFLVDDDHLCILIADVSGKGIPAALFMMSSKIILANMAMQRKGPAEILTAANDAICDHNQEEMFVTVWMGILEISTGKLTAANAGHEYPVLRKPEGVFEIYTDKHGFVIGGMEGVRYREYEIQMEPGSKLFLYTDGVAEATNSELEPYGTDRMVEALNIDPAATPQQTLRNVRASVDAFVKDAEQFDDLTMLCLRYKG